MMSSITLLVLTLLAINATASQNYGGIKSDELCISPSDHYHNRIKRAVIRERSKIWDNGIIPYVFKDGAFTPSEKAVIHQSMNEWMKDSCVIFKERTNEMNYILFVKHGPFCFTRIGMTGGVQEVNIGIFCFYFPGNIVHELGHTLGLLHEHVRPDRDKFIEILWENIMSNQEFNFEIGPRQEVQSFSSDYDYGSIMHYSLYAFSKNGKPTMKPKRPFNGTIGQRDAITKSDYLQLRYLYGCQKYLPPCSITEGSGEYYKHVTLSNDDGDDRNCTDDLLPSPSPTEEEENDTTPSTQHSSYLLLSQSAPSSLYSPFPYSPSNFPQDTLSQTTISDIISPTTTIPHTALTTNQDLSLSMHSLAGTRHQKEASSLSAMLSSVDINTNNVIMIKPTLSTVLTCTSHPIMSSCTMQDQQTDPITLMQKSTASLLSSVSHEMSPTPTNAIWNSIASGDKVALKVANANNTLTIHWMSCYPERCRVKCCENETKGYPYCPMSLFTLEKVSGQSSPSEIRVGDLIVLKPDHNSEMIITCGKGACRGKTYCPILTTKKCKRHHLKIHSLNKKDGDPVAHNDTIELRFNTLPNDYIECNVNDRRCKRYSCQDCSIRPNFIIVKSSLT